MSFALESASWPALLVNAKGVVQAANAAARQEFGPGAEPGANLESLVPAGENLVSLQTILGNPSQTPQLETQLVLTNGKRASFSLRACPAPEGDVLLQAFPASGAARQGETSVLEATTAHKQKLDCALQLTRTVALDFNNALTSILGHTSLILSKMESKHPWRASLLEVEKSAEKAAEIAHDLAAFSLQEKDTKALQLGNINEVMRRSVELFKTNSPATVSWKLELQSRIHSAVFDEAKMQQAMVKILENAYQAVEGFGTVTIRTHNLGVEDCLKDAQVRLGPGSYICVEVQDTGYGIPGTVLPRIFEPFFTTKQGHRGLGLAWVYGIVTNHGGSVAVNSEVNQGTTVRVYLPAQKKIFKDTSTETDDLNGEGTILIIDDEDLLLTMGEVILSSYGYVVLTANSGARGVEIFAAKANEIDLVITDLVMPQMSGREVIEKVRKISPDIKVVCSSGFVRTATGADDHENYLQKPFSSQDLLRKVKEMLVD